MGLLKDSKDKALHTAIVEKCRNKESFNKEEYAFIEKFLKSHENCGESENMKNGSDFEDITNDIFGKKLGTDYDKIDLEKKVSNEDKSDPWDKLLDIPSNSGFTKNSIGESKRRNSLLDNEDKSKESKRKIYSDSDDNSKLSDSEKKSDSKDERPKKKDVKDSEKDANLSDNESEKVKSSETYLASDDEKTKKETKKTKGKKYDSDKDESSEDEKLKKKKESAKKAKKKKYASDSDESFEDEKPKKKKETAKKTKKKKYDSDSDESFEDEKPKKKKETAKKAKKKKYDSDEDEVSDVDSSKKSSAKKRGRPSDSNKSKTERAKRTSSKSSKIVDLSSDESDSETKSAKKRKKSESEKSKTPKSSKKTEKKETKNKTTKGKKSKIADDDADSDKESSKKESSSKSKNEDAANFSDSSEDHEKMSKLCLDIVDTISDTEDNPTTDEEFKKKFNKRRKFITNEVDVPTVEDVKKKFPYLFEKDKMFMEFDLITDKSDLFEKFKKKVKLYAEEVKAAIEPEKIGEKIEKILTDADDDAKEWVSQAVGLLLLPEYMMDDRKGIFIMDEEELPEDHDNRPYAQCEGDLEYCLKEDSSFKIFVENVQICTVNNIMEAIFALMASYYIFNACYPECCENTYYCLERLFIDYSDNSSGLASKIEKKIKALEKSVKKKK